MTINPEIFGMRTPMLPLFAPIYFLKAFCLSFPLPDWPTGRQVVVHHKAEFAPRPR